MNHRITFEVEMPGDAQVFKLEAAVKRVFADFGGLNARMAVPDKYADKSARECVREFHEVFRHPIADGLTAGTPELRVLRVKLLLEEVIELADALGVNITTAPLNRDNLNVPVTQEGLHVYNDSRITPNLVEAADALGDIEYVTHGAALVFGIDLPAVTAEVHRSNMSKLGDEGKPIYRADGKVMKGPNYFKPNIAAVLAKQIGIDLALPSPQLRKELDKNPIFKGREVFVEKSLDPGRAPQAKDGEPVPFD